MSPPDSLQRNVRREGLKKELLSSFLGNRLEDLVNSQPVHSIKKWEACFKKNIDVQLNYHSTKSLWDYIKRDTVLTGWKLDKMKEG